MVNGSRSWKKSSHSTFNGNCVEWRVSTRCNGGQCIEVATPGQVLVRDSKDPGGPVLELSPEAWADLTDRIKSGSLDLP